MPVKKAPRKRAPRKKPVVVEAEVVDDLVPQPPSPVQTLTDNDLDAEQKAEFARLLQSKFSLKDRADALVKLAQMTDTKRAPVGLRAIQEINAITGVRDDKANETHSMFNLPENTSVSIKIEKVVK